MTVSYLDMCRLRPHTLLVSERYKEKMALPLESNEILRYDSFIIVTYAITGMLSVQKKKGHGKFILFATCFGLIIKMVLVIFRFSDNIWLCCHDRLTPKTCVVETCSCSTTALKLVFTAY